MQTREQAKALQQCVDQIYGVARIIHENPNNESLQKQEEGLYRRLKMLLAQLDDEKERAEWTKRLDNKIMPLIGT